MCSNTKISDQTDHPGGTESLFGEALGIFYDIRKLKWKFQVPVHITDHSIEENECTKVVSEEGGSSG